MEAALGGCALLEMHDSPTKNWIPEEYLFQYTERKEVRYIIRQTSVEELTEKGNVLREYVKDRYHPREIYGSMLKEVGLVVPTVETTA